MADIGLGQSDLQRLVAWMDGELSEAEAREVTGLVASDPTWRRAHEEFIAVDRVLARVEPAAPPAGLAERIIAQAHRRRLAGRVAALAGTLAAAAAIVLAAYLGFADSGGRGAGSGPIDQLVARQLHDVPEADRFMVENLGVFENYGRVMAYEQVRSIVDEETLAALEELQGSRDS